MKKLIILLILLFAWPAWGATVYVKKIAGSIYYDSTATCCDDVTVADTGPSDVDTAAGVAGAGGTLYICEGTYTETQIDGDSQLTPRNSQIIIGIGTVLLDGNNVPNVVIYRDGGPGATLRNIRVTGSAFDGIQIRNLNSCVIDQCTVYENAHTGIYIYARDQNVTGLEITDNTVYNNGGADASGDNQILLKARVGAAAYTITDPIITGNTVYGSLNTGYSGIKLWGAYTDPNTGTVTGAVVTGNEVYGMEYGGIDLYGNVDNSTVSDNNIHDLEWCGVHVQGHAGANVSSGNTIEDNVISTVANRIADGAGVLIDNLAGADNTIKNNTIKDCEEAGVKVRGTTTDVLSNSIYGTGVYGIFYQAALDTICPDTLNNTVAGNFSGGGIYVQAGATCAGGAGSMQNNIVYDTGTSPYGIYIPTDCSATENYNCVYGFDTHNFADQNGAMAAGANSIESDPKFVDAANNDYHLLVSSPCIDAGANLTATVLTDIDGQDADHANMDGDADGSSTDMDIGADQVPFKVVMTAAGTSSYVLIDGQDDNYAGLAISGGQTIDNVTISRCPSGAFRVNGNQTVNNMAIDDECYVASGVTLTANNCAFQEAKATAQGDGTITDTDCQFSISDFGFVDKSNGDFTLQSTSVCINQGTDTGSGDQTDVDGNDLYGAMDVGAQEYQQPENALWFNNVTGDDSNTSISSSVPLLTFDHLSRLGLADGCTIYLQRGQTWADTFDTPSPGFLGGVITLKSYGSGTPPILTGIPNFDEEYWEVEGIEFR